MEFNIFYYLCCCISTEPLEQDDYVTYNEIYKQPFM